MVYKKPVCIVTAHVVNLISSPGKQSSDKCEPWNSGKHKPLDRMETPSEVGLLRGHSTNICVIGLLDHIYVILE